MRNCNILLFLFFAISGAIAQTPTESGIPLGGGLLIYKDQAYYGNNLASAIIYRSVRDLGGTSDRTFEFCVLNGGKITVSESGILGNYRADAINVMDLLPGQSLEDYKNLVLSIEKLSRLNANVAAVCVPILNQINGNLGHIAEGKILVSGEWKIPSVAVEKANPLKIKELTTTEGDVYKNAVFKSSDNVKVAFSHEDGVARVAWDKIKKEDQKTWGYDAEKVKAELIAQKKIDEEKIKAEADRIAAENQKQEEERKKNEAEAQRLAQIEEAKKAKLAEEQRLAQAEQDRIRREAEKQGLATAKASQVQEALNNPPILTLLPRGPAVHGFQLGMPYADFLDNLKTLIGKDLNISTYGKMDITDLIAESNLMGQSKVIVPQLIFDAGGNRYAAVLVAGKPLVVVRIFLFQPLLSKIFKMNDMAYHEFCQAFIDNYKIPKLSGYSENDISNEKYESPDGWAITIDERNAGGRTVELKATPEERSRGFGK